SSTSGGGTSCLGPGRPKPMTAPLVAARSVSVDVSPDGATPMPKLSALKPSTETAPVAVVPGMAAPPPQPAAPPERAREGWRAARLTGDVVALGTTLAVATLVLGSAAAWSAATVLAVLVCLALHEAGRVRLRVRPTEEIALVVRVAAVVSLGVAAVRLLSGEPGGA